MAGGAYPCDAAVDLNLDDLALNDLALLGYAHADGLAKGLGEGLGLGHFQREDLRRGQHGEGHVGAERLGHAHCDGRLARAGGPGDEDGAACNLAFLGHSQNHGGGLARLVLSNQALRRRLGLERVGLDAETANVRVRGDEVEPAQLFALGNGGDGLDGVSRSM